MDFIITFFRDVLDGPLYIGVTIVCSILICACIGYLGEQYLNKKKKMQEFLATHAEVSVDNNVGQVVGQPAELSMVSQTAVVAGQQVGTPMVQPGAVQQSGVVQPGTGVTTTTQGQ